VKEPLTDGEERVLKVMLQHKSVREMAEALDLSTEAMIERMERLFMKLRLPSDVDPPPLPPAASAALPVPLQRAEDIPRHVGKPLRRSGGSS
jgi:hypothetical protein